MQELISILIPAHNAAATIDRAIGSCLSQSFGNFEILILDNGSDDGTVNEILKINDPRIRIIRLDANIGIAPARNRLLAEARGEFVAWLDADDEMLADRLKIQLTYFKDHPEVDIVGSWITTDSEKLPYKKLPLGHELIKACLWFKNTIIQPSVMSRNFYMMEGILYNEAFCNSAEDYEMWYRLSSTKKFANIPAFLTKYHMTTGVALDLKRRRTDFEENIRKLWDVKWRDLNNTLTIAEKDAFVFFLYNNRTITSAETRLIASALHKLWLASNEPYFRLILRFHMLRLWLNMKLFSKIFNLHLLSHALYYNRMKRLFLV